MKFGNHIFDIQDAPLNKALGFDYFEFAFGQFTDMSDEEFESFKKAVFELDFFPEAMSRMLPARFQIVGDDPDLSEVIPFLEKGFARACQVGTKTVVFGSGGARSLPDGFTDMRKAYAQLVDFLRIAGDIAHKNGITISIEPLQFGESNIVNLVTDGAYLAARVNHPAVRCLADYYHMASNEEQCWEIEAIADRLEHCHIARLEGRTYPLPTDTQDYRPFFDALKKIGYTGRVSIEGTPEHGMEKDGAAALALMKALAK